LNGIKLLLLLLAGLPLYATAVQLDEGPLPPPEGPFFSSKPLLYFGEEPAETKTLAFVPPPSTSGVGRYRYPYYSAPTRFGFSPDRIPFQQRPPLPQAWGAPRYYPMYPNQQGFRNRGRYPVSPPIFGRGGR
ncbi:MAG: hypothetical protein OEL79_05865, partial [Chromatiales bacterium]|nr:hypothetical protein [Chromatiales bacterium]